MVERLTLHDAYPNPFNPVTTLRFDIPEQAQVSLAIYDLQGRQVASLVDGMLSAGQHSVPWNAEGYSSGVYFVKIMAGGYMDTQKLLLVK